MYIKHFGQTVFMVHSPWTRVFVPKDTPTETDISKLISKDLKRLGFKFVGQINLCLLTSSWIYNDHQNDCF